MKRVIVRKPLKLLLRLCQIVALIAIVGVARAQEAYAPITLENVAQITQLKRIGRGVPREMIFSADGTRLAVATTLGIWITTFPEVITQYPMPTESAAMQLFEGQSGAFSVAFSPDGAQIAGGGDDGSVMVWDAASGAGVVRLENHIYPVRALAWTGTLLASGDQSGVVRLWDTPTWSENRVITLSDLPILKLELNTEATQLDIWT
jgi:WD40 repeat protein